MANHLNENGVSALLLGEYEGERLLVAEVFRAAGWRLFEARNRSEALKCIRRKPVRVVIAENDLPQWNWKHILQDFHDMRCPAQLVVASRTADDRLWSEVLNLGGYDVLSRPFDRDELHRVVASAGRHFERQTVGSVDVLPSQAFGAA